MPEIPRLGKTGADNRTGLEPDALFEALDELEDWGAVLAAEPDVVQKLREFDAAARDTRELSNQERELTSSLANRGPSP